MPGIGLRGRFFLTTLAVLLVVTVGTVFMHGWFLHQERLRLIDQQVRETAFDLVDSQLGDLRMINFDEAEEIISEELGEGRIGKFFIIRDARGEPIFESAAALVLPLEEIPRNTQWVSLEANGQYIRVLNLKLPSFPDRTLQVGVVIDKALVSPSYFSTASLSLMVVVLVLGSVASFFLTSFLLRPIALLDRFLLDVARQSKVQSELPMVPDEIHPDAKADSSDEFERVVAGLNALIDKVNRNSRFVRLWAYQMAHEIKTPLSIMRLDAERLQREVKAPEGDESIRKILRESDKVSDVINAFLGWAELESAPQKKELFAQRAGSLARTVVERFESGFRDRIQLIVDHDPVVVANPQHLEQVVSNLLMNALVYSGSEKKVIVRVTSDRLSVTDEGPGLPPDVLDRLGEPFNRGTNEAASGKRRGHGLGLAWIKTICRLYSWEMDVRTGSQGTTIEIRFGAIDEEFSPLNPS